jgi:hypothetical protein
MAVAPQGSTKGDEVYIPSHSTMPFVLRPQGPSPALPDEQKGSPMFAVVGPVWITGVVDEEVVANEKYKVETIFIK